MLLCCAWEWIKCSRVYWALRVIYLAHWICCVHYYTIVVWILCYHLRLTPSSYLQPLTKLYHHHHFNSLIHSPSSKPSILIFLLLQPALGIEPFTTIHQPIHTKPNSTPVLPKPLNCHPHLQWGSPSTFIHPSSTRIIIFIITLSSSSSHRTQHKHQSFPLSQHHCNLQIEDTSLSHTLFIKETTHCSSYNPNPAISIHTEPKPSIPFQHQTLKPFS